MLVSFIREQVVSGLIDIRKIPTEDNIADVLTKPLSGKSFEEKAHFLLGIMDYEITDYEIDASQR